jgi:hypothetical protein
LLENSLAGLDSVKLMPATSLCVFGILLAACAELFGPAWASRPGSIVDGSLVVPDTAVVLANFVVTLTTRGDVARDWRL